jgi:hypothetical protein
MNATSGMVYAMLIASGLVGSLTFQVIPHMPRPELSDYFEVSSVEAHRDGQTAILYVDRVIKTPLMMSFDVRVFEVRPEGAWLVCVAAGGPYNYRPDAILPNPVTLEWWTNGACNKLPDGDVQIETTWDPIVPDFPPISVTTEVTE